MTSRPPGPSRGRRRAGTRARHLATAGGRAAATSRLLRASPRHVLAATGALALAVVVGVLGAGGTYALFSSSVAAPAGTVRAGQAGLTVTTSRPSLTGLVPGASVLSTTTVTNTGDVRLALFVAATGTTSAYEAVPGTAPDGLQLRVTPVARAQDCAPGLRDGSTAPLRSWTAPRTTTAVLAARTGTTTPTQVLCLELSLAADAPSGTQGAVVGLDVVVSGTQVRA